MTAIILNQAVYNIFGMPCLPCIVHLKREVCMCMCIKMKFILLKFRVFSMYKLYQNQRIMERLAVFQHERVKEKRIFIVFQKEVLPCKSLMLAHIQLL